MKNRMSAAVVAAALVAGLFAGAVISSPNTADAQVSDDTTTAVEAPRSLQEVLDALVADGTLTTAQAEAVGDALAEARDERVRDSRQRRHIRHGAGLLSDLLELEPGQLREAISGGSTIAELAAAAGLTTDDVVAALVDAASDRLDTAVENGRIDAEEAAEKLEQIEERATALVNGEFEFEGHRGHGPRRMGPPDAGPDTDPGA